MGNFSLFWIPFYPTFQHHCRHSAVLMKGNICSLRKGNLEEASEITPSSACCACFHLQCCIVVENWKVLGPSQERRKGACHPMLGWARHPPETDHLSMLVLGRGDALRWFCSTPFLLHMPRSHTEAPEACHLVWPVLAAPLWWRHWPFVNFFIFCPLVSLDDPWCYVKGIKTSLYALSP